MPRILRLAVGTTSRRIVDTQCFHRRTITLRLALFLGMAGNEGKVVVMDNGSLLSRAGLAGDETPLIVFPSTVSRRRVASEFTFSDVYLGEDAATQAQYITAKYPIDRGVVKNWSDMEDIWSFAFRWLDVDSREHPVIVSEPILNPKVNRERMIELMMETFEVPSFFVALQTVLSLYASGRTTGVVVEIGDGVMQLMPFFEGTSFPRAERRLHFAGRDVTEWMRNLLETRGFNFTSWAQREILRKIKEHVAYVALDPDAEEGADDPASYTLPSGRSITLGAERWAIPEVLFRPYLNGFEHDGLDKLVVESIMTCPIGLRRTLYESVLPSGGTTLLPNLIERLESGIAALAPPSVKVAVASWAERRHAVWLGGSVLGSLPTFAEIAVTAAEYADEGPAIAHRRCFAVSG